MRSDIRPVRGGRAGARRTFLRRTSRGSPSVPASVRPGWCCDTTPFRSSRRIGRGGGRGPIGVHKRVTDSIRPEDGNGGPHCQSTSLARRFATCRPARLPRNHRVLRLPMQPRPEERGCAAGHRHPYPYVRLERVRPRRRLKESFAAVKEAAGGGRTRTRQARGTGLHAPAVGAKLERMRARRASIRDRLRAALFGGIAAERWWNSAGVQHARLAASFVRLAARARRMLSAKASCGEHGLEYGLASAACGFLQFVATSDRARFSQFPFVAVCCSGSAGTLNPKVEGSSPYGSVAKCLQSGPLWCRSGLSPLFSCRDSTDGVRGRERRMASLQD
jgi:hypothetical protein